MYQLTFKYEKLLWECGYTLLWNGDVCESMCTLLCYTSTM